MKIAEHWFQGQRSGGFRSFSLLLDRREKLFYGEYIMQTAGNERLFGGAI
jgi:hypothetical protein